MSEEKLETQVEETVEAAEEVVEAVEANRRNSPLVNNAAERKELKLVKKNQNQNGKNKLFKSVV